MICPDDLKDFLNAKVEEYNTRQFILNDPISIPHQFSKKQDIEIMGFWASILSWGRRTTIINKCQELIKLMDGAPYDFVLNHKESDLMPFLKFKHRTFNEVDTLYFLTFFQNYYKQNESLEYAFNVSPKETNIGEGINRFHQQFFQLPEFPERTKKHIAAPLKKSACKRINMFLRWMVRKDVKGVDFGIWNTISPSQLICPIDVHVERVARGFKLLHRQKMDWLAATELTENLKLFDAVDPVKYDFALFGLGQEGKF